VKYHLIKNVSTQISRSESYNRAFIYCNYLFRVVKAIVYGGEWL